MIKNFQRASDTALRGSTLKEFAMSLLEFGHNRKSTENLCSFVDGF